MKLEPLTALCPLDGRYYTKTRDLAEIFSEASLIKHRVLVEVEYLLALSQQKIIRPFSGKEKKLLKSLPDLSFNHLKRVKEIEKTIHHDVKSVEYYLAERLEKTSLKDCVSFIHFGLTSSDINNLAYRLMMAKANNLLRLRLEKILKQLNTMANEYKNLSMLARTHGQAAIPTTFGKEVSVFGMRLLNQLKKIENYKLTGKLNGAVGSFQALQFSLPKVNWIKFSRDLVKSFDLKPNLDTTQVNPADDLVELFSIYHLVNSILIDLSQDFWRYISDDWLIQNKNLKQVGSSTMPQKVNPIEFENAEGNLSLANGLIETLNRKLPISRLQRDLSDSTVNRNMGLVLGYSLVAYTSLLKGLKLVKPNKKKITKDLNKNFNILSEALQTDLRLLKDKKAYQKTVKLTKSKVMNQDDWQKLVKPINGKLFKLTPDKYTGLAGKLTDRSIRRINKYIRSSHANN